MKVPTTGTSVFAPIARTGTGSNATVNAGFPPDLVFETIRSSPSYGPYECDRLRGSNLYLTTTSTVAEADGGGLISFDAPTGNFVGNNSVWETSGNLISNWAFRRAPGFFDEVCYTGNENTARAVPHNLQAVPELIIFKLRNLDGNNPWWTYAAPVGATKYLQLNSAAAPVTLDIFANTAPTASNFFVNGNYFINYQQTVVAYLFATCPGVSKVGSYTGNGTTQAIACGFTGGARFVLIKRTDSTGDWYVYDTARGMTVLTDPYLLLNSTAAETATLGSVTTSTGGFTVDATILAAINTNAASYVFLAIS
jgi:hypothetical protein